MQSSVRTYSSQRQGSAQLTRQQSVLQLEYPIFIAQERVSATALRTRFGLSVLNGVAVFAAPAG